MRKIIGHQGEVRIIKIYELPKCESRPVKPGPKGFVISHSEQGNHHLLSGGEVMERTSGVPEGMKIFYAITKTDERFYQDAVNNPHGEFSLPPGLYAFIISREHDHFLKQARIVAD